MLKKTKLSLIGFVSAPIIFSSAAIPLAIIGANSGFNPNYKNVFSTFDNILDNLISLGYAPDYHTLSNAGKTKYSVYLNDYVNDDITQYVNILIRNGQEVDRNAVNALQVNTVILNENMKGLAFKFNNIANYITYSSRGDSAQARYSTPMTVGGYNWTSQNSTDNALLIQANDLDNVYKTFNNQFTNTAKEIIAKNEQRISFINENNKEKTKDKTIGIVYANSANPSDIDKNFYICSPYVYPMLYGDGNKGIGLSFPEPKDSSFINTTHGYYDTSWRIMASNGDELIEQFTSKFDYLIYCAPDISPGITQELVFNSNLKKMLKVQSSFHTNLVVSTMGEWYTPAWATIGKNFILDKTVELLNLTDIDPSLKWQPKKPSELKRLREI